MYADDFAAKGSDAKACDRWPVRDLCEDHAGFCDGHLGIPRCKMPQLPSIENHEKFDTWKSILAAEGINISITDTPVAVDFFGKLKASQKFLNKCKVCSMTFSGESCFQAGPATADTCKDRSKTGCFCFWQSGISVTEDDHILDGHHRWAAGKIMSADETLPKATSVVIERYHNGLDEQPAVTTKTVVETADRHPKLITHTKCSAEEAAENLEQKAVVDAGADSADSKSAAVSNTPIGGLFLIASTRFM